MNIATTHLLHVLKSSNQPKIRQGIIGLVLVDVVYLITIWDRPIERLPNQAVNITPLGKIIVCDCNLVIASLAI